MGLSEHLKEHPHDYQAVIAYYKRRSKMIEKEIRERQIAKLKRIAECRRILNGGER